MQMREIKIFQKVIFLPDSESDFYSTKCHIMHTKAIFYHFSSSTTASEKNIFSFRLSHVELIITTIIMK